ncbi:MAG: DNA primase [Candidatus Melainabacteria bacterium]|nr:DNA primase [Candidatus Melainabacteria bacterium]
MKGVTTEVIAEVRQRAGIVEVISETVVLKRAGKEYRGLCPFHNEKSGSFYVNPEKGIFKCFGCGEGGDVFAFLQKAKGTDFIDTVRDLANRYGVRLVESVEEKQHYDRRAQFFALNDAACNYFTELLQDPTGGATARRYLEGRGVSEEILKRFKLGFAPNSWDGLLRYLNNTMKVSEATLEEAGLVRRRAESTGVYDLFRNRLMVPIMDDQGRVVAFGGRTLGDDQVKYLNSPETPIYVKGQHLYGYHLAKEAIKAKDAVIVVEGYFDAISLHQYGFENAVATLGTALTEQQAKMLVRYTESKRVYLSFDSDPAGVKAVERGVETLNQIAEGVGIELKVIRIPGGKDPDECLRSEGGQEAFARAMETAPPLIDYELRQALKDADTSTHTGRLEAAMCIVPILAQIKNYMVRGEYIRLFAMEIGAKEDELSHSVREQIKQKTKPFRQENFGSSAAKHMRNRGTVGTPGSGGLAGVLEAERNLLALLLTNREDYSQAFPVVMDLTFNVPAHKLLKEAFQGVGDQFATVQDLTDRVMDRAAPDKAAAAALIDVILKVEEFRKQQRPSEVVIKDSFARLIKERLELANRQMRAQLASPLPEDELIQLQGKISRLRKLQDSDLPTASSLADLNELALKIDEIFGDSAGVAVVNH